ncbi:MAG: hypothetical protein RL145_823 [Pseudomonadota bacterium]|jgi:hypothetical protein
MFKKLFVEHPESVGESYFEHLGVAFSFGFQMLGAAFACIIHGLIPGLFKSTGSQTICCLHDRMVLHRNRKHAATSAPIAQSGETALS